MTTQAASLVLMVRPACFGFNVETAASNSFQQQGVVTGNVVHLAQQEFDAAVETLKKAGLSVYVAQDTPEPHKPDAVFPNNWVSFHPNGTVYLYPMATPNRRLERRLDIVEALSQQVSITQVVDISHFEDEQKILEGTGSLVCDHVHQRMYACVSPRTDAALVAQHAERLGYSAHVFTATTTSGDLIYHTNVLMAVLTQQVVICLEAIKDHRQKEDLLKQFAEDQLEVIAITLEQMNQFCGNVLEVLNQQGQRCLVLSETAFNAFTPAQRERLADQRLLVPVHIPTIETIGGGSARCMVCEVFCKPLPA